MQTDTVLMLIEQLYQTTEIDAAYYKLKLINLSKADPNNFAIKYYLAHGYLTALGTRKSPATT
jgi:hypothetical protein